MLVVISPAKKLNMQPSEDIVPTKPIFGDEANELADVMQNLSLDKLQSLMAISENLAKLNADRFAHFGSQDKKPAALAFAGDTYLGLEAASLEPDEMAWAQNHLRVLSGLYGVLRPLDAIEPYRLEMGSRLKVENTSDLYAYWGSRLSNEINLQAKSTKSTLLLNCASQEYFKAVDNKSLELEVITPQFFELTSKGPKQISFYAKKARGAMARYVVENRIATIEDLIQFNLAGYSYNSKESSRFSPVFFRKND